MPLFARLSEVLYSLVWSCLSVQISLLDSRDCHVMLAVCLVLANVYLLCCLPQSHIFYTLWLYHVLIFLMQTTALKQTLNNLFSDSGIVFLIIERKRGFQF